MQRRHEEEMVAVWAECLAQLNKGKAAKTGKGAGGEREKIVTLDAGEKEAHSSTQGREERRQEEDKVGKGETMVLVKSEGPSVPVPFVQAVMDVHISDQFVPPQFKMYDGIADPEAHIKSFTNSMAFRTGFDAIWC